MFTRVRHWSLSWARWIHPKSPHPICLRYILIITSDLVAFLISILLRPSAWYTPPSYPPLLIILIIFGEGRKLWMKPSLYNFLENTVTAFLGPNILLTSLLSDKLKLCFSLNMRDQISHSYKTTGTIIVLYCIQNFNLCAFAYQTGRQTILHWIKASNLQI
jgi:hypothetical protein